MVFGMSKNERRLEARIIRQFRVEAGRKRAYAAFGPRRRQRYGYGCAA
jgi:hypothetical protein